MKMVVIKDCSAGNETVGEAWQETKIFEPSATLEDVMRWAMNKADREIKTIYRGKITLTIADNWED